MDFTWWIAASDDDLPGRDVVAQDLELLLEPARIAHPVLAHADAVPLDARVDRVGHRRVGARVRGDERGGGEGEAGGDLPFARAMLPPERSARVGRTGAASDGRLLARRAASIGSCTVVAPTR
jgi:hypothetical protein